MDELADGTAGSVDAATGAAKELFTWMRLFAIGLILAGIFLLQRTSG